MEIKEKIMEHTKEVEDIIVKFLPAEEGYQKTVMEAMNYSFLAGGKRLRPMLMLKRIVCLVAAQKRLSHLYGSN